MKKIVCILLTFVMVMSLSVTAFAVDENLVIDEHGGGSKEITVTSTISKDTTENKSAKVYSVKVTWTFTPSAGGTKIKEHNQYTWDPASLKYTIANATSDTTYTLTNGDQIAYSITVENRSNADIHYSITWTKSVELSDEITVDGGGTGIANEQLNRADTNGATKYTVGNDYSLTVGAGFTDLVGTATTSSAYTGTLTVSCDDSDTLKDLYNEPSFSLGTFTVSLPQEQPPE